MRGQCEVSQKYNIQYRADKLSLLSVPKHVTMLKAHCGSITKVYNIAVFKWWLERILAI